MNSVKYLKIGTIYLKESISSNISLALVFASRISTTMFLTNGGTFPISKLNCYINQ